MCFSPQEVLGEIQVLLSGCGKGVEVPGAGAEDGEGQLAVQGRKEQPLAWEEDE